MSSECWTAHGECAVRAHACGHVAHVSHTPDGIKLPAVCVKCGCGEAGIPVLDLVPTLELTWSVATCSQSTVLTARTNELVCAFMLVTHRCYMEYPMSLISCCDRVLRCMPW